MSLHDTVAEIISWDLDISQKAIFYTKNTDFWGRLATLEIKLFVYLLYNYLYICYICSITINLLPVLNLCDNNVYDYVENRC